MAVPLPTLELAQPGGVPGKHAPFHCPRRDLVQDQAQDTWNGDSTCSYCGSARPEDFFRHVERGAAVIPTDKRYKVYLEGESVTRFTKVYLQHLSKEQQARFIEMHNAGTMRIGFPGYFYVTPFFATPKGTQA